MGWFVNLLGVMVAMAFQNVMQTGFLIPLVQVVLPEQVPKVVKVALQVVVIAAILTANKERVIPVETIEILALARADLGVPTLQTMG